MAKATTTITFADGTQVTSARLNEIISGFSLGADSVDASTITLSGGGVLSVGTVAAGNIGTGAVTTIKLADASVTAAKIGTQAVETAGLKDLNVTGAKVAEDTLAWTKTLTADRAVQADMQSETAAHFVAPSVLKYHPGVAKAYGRVSATNGSAALSGGYNVTSATESGSDRVITLAVTMANTNYIVDLAYEDASTVGAVPAIHTKTTTGFSIAVTEAASRFVMFKVHGQLA
jgi:hypothetical protein